MSVYYVTGNVFKWFTRNNSFIPHNYIKGGKTIFEAVFFTVDKNIASRLEMNLLDQVAIMTNSRDGITKETCIPQKKHVSRSQKSDNNFLL